MTHLDLRSDELKGKVALVTGAGAAGNGIGNGRGSALLLAEHGARVALLDINDSNLETKRMIEARGGECVTVTCDVTDAAAVSTAVEGIFARWGRVDVLVNNVGIAGPPGNVVDVDLAEWTRCFEINVTSMLIVSRFVIPKMRLGGGGSIVNMSSIAGTRGGHAAIAYATTKGAIVNLTQAMAVHHGSDGIRVNAVAPGLVFTPMVMAGGIDEARRADRAASNLLHTEGTGWDVAESVLFLAGPRSRWITGTVMTVDGGVSSFIDATRNSITSAGATSHAQP